MLLPVAILSSLKEQYGKHNSGLLGLKTGEWEEEVQQHGSIEWGGDTKTHAPRYCLKQDNLLTQ